MQDETLHIEVYGIYCISIQSMADKLYEQTTGKKGGSKEKPGSCRKSKGSAPAAVEWDLQLYVAGSSRKSELALCNLKWLCEEHLAGRYRIQIIDLTKNPQLAHAEQITALPALVRKHSFPILKIIGTLFDTERVLAGLDPVRPIAPGSKLFNDSNCVSTDTPWAVPGTINGAIVDTPKTGAFLWMETRSG